MGIQGCFSGLGLDFQLFGIETGLLTKLKYQDDPKKEVFAFLHIYLISFGILMAPIIYKS